MDTERVLVLREALARTGWVERTVDFARSLRRVREPGSLLLVGTPDAEPWHLAAHLDDEARYGRLPQLSPTLVRWSAPAGAPAHLAVTMARLEAAARGETVFVVAPVAPPEALLERVADARRVGATLLSIDTGDDALSDLVHDRLIVPSDVHLDLPTTDRGPMTTVDIETVSHLVSVAAGDSAQRMTPRARLARLLERISGPSPRS